MRPFEGRIVKNGHAISSDHYPAQKRGAGSIAAAVAYIGEPLLLN